MTDHTPSIAAILARDLPQVSRHDRDQITAEIVHYLAQVEAGQGAALKALKQDDHACGQISLAQALAAIHLAQPMATVPRPRAPIVTEASDGSWVPDKKHGSAS